MDASLSQEFSSPESDGNPFQARATIELTLLEITFLNTSLGRARASRNHFFVSRLS